MSRVGRLFCSLMIPFIGSALVAAQSAKTKPTKEPTTFTGEDRDNGFDHANPPSDVVLDALLKTPEAQEMSSELDDLGREEQRKLFQATPVHLTNPEEVDEVILGHTPMSGADNDWFWIVRHSRDGAEVILFASGLALDLLDSRSLGYKNIRTVWAAASGLTITCVYHYDGNRYQLVHKYTKTVSTP